MKKEIGKKAAIELSMTTIIVIILSVVLLGLGLVFIKNIFDMGLNPITEQAFANVDKAIRDQMGSNQKVYVQGQTFEVSSGKSITINVGVQNFGTETTASEFSVDVAPGSGGGSKDWFLSQKVTATIGKKKAMPILL